MQNLDSALVETLANLSWDDVRIFLTVVSTGSFKAAAKMLSRSTNTVRTHVKRLEDIVGVALLERSAFGVTLTDAGLQLTEVAKEMAAASRSVPGTAPEVLAAASRVHLHVSEGVGTFWMVPRLVEFRRRHPDIPVRLNCSLTPLHRFEQSNSIAVQMVRPEDPDAVCVHLGALHLLPFASPDYIRRNGVPRDLQDARRHQVVIQSAEQIRDDVFPMLFGDNPPPGLVALETNSSAAHYWAIAKGLGIGMLPTYARAITKSVVPIEMNLMFRRDLWLAYPLAAKESKMMREIIQWVKASFNHAAYPWFSDEFVHPDRFEDNFEGTNVVRLFAGFMDIAE